MARRSAEVVIVGGGIVGCAVAYQLTSAGLDDVVVLERAHLAAGATGVCPGGIRQQFEGEADCRLARRAMGFWRRVNELLEPPQPFVFEPSGYLFVADSPALLERFTANVARQNGLGIPSRILAPAELRRRWPALCWDGVAGASFCAEDGFLEDCHGVTVALARRAEALGARVHYQEARAVRRRRRCWEVETAAGPIACRHLVLANAAGALALAAPLGVDLSISRRRRRLAFTEPYEPWVLPPLLVAPERAFAGKQLRYGVFYLGWLAERGGEGETVFLERALSAGAAFLPALAELPVRRTMSGVYDVTPDHRPILGPVPGLPDLWLATGMSGHGFMIAPAVGELLASLILGRDADLPAAAFALERFARPPAAEGLVI